MCTECYCLAARKNGLAVRSRPRLRTRLSGLKVYEKVDLIIDDFFEKGLLFLLRRRRTWLWKLVPCSEDLQSDVFQGMPGGVIVEKLWDY